MNDSNEIDPYYSGQKEKMELVLDKEVITGNAYPTVIQYYNEIYRGQKKWSVQID